MASNDQKKKAAIKDKKKLEELDKTFKEDLTKAIEYFEKLHTVNNKDYTTILYLIQDYDALENKEKSSKFLNELDNLRNTELYKDENYWLAVGKAYAKPDPKKSLLAFKTADAITEARKKANQSELERLIESLDKLTKAVEESNKK
jgi:hypothetical protein